MFGFGRKKKIEPICGNCRLFNKEARCCSVIVLHEGEKINIPVDAIDPCFFEEQYFDPITGRVENFNDIKEIKIWTEDENGKKSDKGVVKMQVPNELAVARGIDDII